MDPEEISDIPENDVPEVVKDYILSGAEKITVIRQNDGNWTVRAE